MKTTLLQRLRFTYGFQSWKGRLKEYIVEPAEPLGGGILCILAGTFIVLESLTYLVCAPLRMLLMPFYYATVKRAACERVMGWFKTDHETK